MKEQRKFVILSNPRSGSEYMVKLLNQHSKIFCMGEIFSIGPDGEAWNHSTYKHELRPFAYLDYEYSKTDKMIVGYKQISYWIYNSCFESVEDFIKKCISQNYVFIHMTRLNFLAQYASFMIMMDQGLGHVVTEERYHKTIHLDPALTYMTYRKWTHFDKICSNILEKEHADFIKLVYEEDFDSKKLAKRKVFEFLTVPYEEISDPLKRTNPFAIEDIITNYDEVVTYLEKKLKRKGK